MKHKITDFSQTESAAADAAYEAAMELQNAIDGAQEGEYCTEKVR